MGQVQGARLDLLDLVAHPSKRWNHQEITTTQREDWIEWGSETGRR